MKRKELIYFNHENMKLNDIANENLEYIRIYMNTSKQGNTTNIPLSKYEGDILYILSNIDNEKYSGYFKKEIIEGVESIDIDKKVTEQINPPKKMKQSNLFNFVKK